MMDMRKGKMILSKLFGTLHSDFEWLFLPSIPRLETFSFLHIFSLAHRSWKKQQILKREKL